MVKTLLAQVKEFKKDSLLTPVFMILEVILETLIPLCMASIYLLCKKIADQFYYNVLQEKSQAVILKQKE